MSDRLTTALLNLEALRRAKAGDNSPFVAPPDIAQELQPSAPATRPSAPQKRHRRGVVTTRQWLGHSVDPPPEQAAPPPPSRSPARPAAPAARPTSQNMPEGVGTRLPPWIAAHPESGKRWEYSQSTGQLSYDGVPFGDPGYAGRGAGLNNPEMQGVRNIGPVPQGDYTMGDTSNYNWNNRDHPYATPLIPASGNDMHGRSGFLIHGGPKQPTYSASEGCIIMPDGTRIYLDRTQNRNLRVTA
jgi:hypothetical protein